MNATPSLKNTNFSKLAQHLTQVSNEKDESLNEIVLIEINHFIPAHCVLPVIIRSLLKTKKFRFIPYLPLEQWDADHRTFQFVLQFYESMGIDGNILKPSPTPHHFQMAKKTIIENMDFFRGNIWTLTDFELDNFPMGVHFVESMLQKFNSAEFEQDSTTVAYCMSLIARYFWWKEYLSSNPIKYIFSSHFCYEFVLPQLAGMRIGIDCYHWCDTMLRRSDRFLPLESGNDAYVGDLYQDWSNLSALKKKSYLDLAHDELQRRSFGERVGVLKKDPRFVSKESERNFPEDLAGNEKANIIIYCHAFSDAPCTLPKKYHNNLCSPLISTRRLLELCNELPLNVFVKTHPQPFPQDDLALNNLLNIFKNVTRLPSDVTLQEISNFGKVIIITGYGSVSYEARYLGLPVIAYTSFAPVSNLLTIPVFDLNDEFSFHSTLIEVLSSEVLDLDRDYVAKIYSIINLGLQQDLTSSNLSDLPHQGDRGQYSLYGYKHWADTFNLDQFNNISSALDHFFGKKAGVFSRFATDFANDNR